MQANNKQNKGNFNKNGSTFYFHIFYFNDKLLFGNYYSDWHNGMKFFFQLSLTGLLYSPKTKPKNLETSISSLVDP
jgi:hypothetical protein